MGDLNRQRRAGEWIVLLVKLFTLVLVILIAVVILGHYALSKLGRDEVEYVGRGIAIGCVGFAIALGLTARKRGDK